MNFDIKTKVLQIAAVFTILMMCNLPMVAASTRFGDRYCYRQGSLWYCARYDYSSFYSGGCAGTVPAPHLNLEIGTGSTNGLNSTMLQNWHIGWKQYNKDYCLVSYEPNLYKYNRAAGCIKVCYPSKSGQAGDILSRIGFPQAMKYDSQISSVFNRLYMGSGYSPYTTWISGAGVTLIAAAATISVLAWVTTIAITFVIGM